MNFENYILEAIKPNKVFVEDAECIDEVEDYKSVLDELFSLTRDELKLQSFSGEENLGIELKLVLNEVKYIINLEYGLGSLDNINLVKGLNKILKSKKSKNKFYTFWSSDSFGQEVGFFYTDQVIGKKIIQFAKKHNLSVENFIEQYQISDGKTKIGYEEE